MSTADRPVPQGLRLRPLPFSDLLDEIFRLYRRRFMLLWGSALVASVPGLLYAVAAGGMMSSIGFGPATVRSDGSVSPQLTTALASAGLMVGLVGVLALALAPLWVFTPYRAAMAAATGEQATVGSVVSWVMRSYGRLFLLILYWIPIALLFLTCLLSPVAIWIFIRWLPSPAVLMAEGIPARQALSRSWHLVENHWWRTLGILLLASLLQLVVTYAVTALAEVSMIGALSSPGGASWIFIPVEVITTLASTVITPVIPLFVTLLYYDLRVRKENLDLQLLAAQAAQNA